MKQIFATIVGFLRERFWNRGIANLGHIIQGVIGVAFGVIWFIHLFIALSIPIFFTHFLIFILADLFVILAISALFFYMDTYDHAIIFSRSIDTALKPPYLAMVGFFIIVSFILFRFYFNSWISADLIQKTHDVNALIDYERHRFYVVHYFELSILFLFGYSNRKYLLSHAQKPLPEQQNIDRWFFEKIGRK